MSPSRTRWFAGVLLLALVPAIAYVGHWEPRFDIPLTDYYWGIPEGRGHSHSSDDDSHGDHCHGDSTCAGKPTTAGAGVALLRADVEMLGVAAFLLLVMVVVARPPISGSYAPEPPPPRRPHRAV